tara:strand:+ start:555 stop:1838 length:1284 start_codon:yes stop_codon:yes gene_type:complete
MDTEPELPIMTRRRTISPLVAAWAFVLISFGSVILWLSLSDGPPPSTRPADEQVAVGEDTGTSAGPAQAAPPQTTPEPGEQVIVLDASAADGSETDAENALSPLTQSKTPPESENPSVADTDMVAEDTPVRDNRAAPAPQPPPTVQNSADTAMPYTREMSLAPAPDPGLVIDGPHGPLPVLGPDGKVAWKEYARPHEELSAAPRIAILVTGIGLNSRRSEKAIRDLPGEMALALSPYGRNLQDWADRARQAGHELFLMLPMEPQNYPQNDPGPHTLMTTFAVRDNLKRLEWLLSRFTGYVGVVNDMGSKFTASEEAVGPVLDDLNGRGLMFLDSRSSRYSIAAQYARRIGMPRAVNTRFLDNVVRRQEILKRLEELENTANTYGAAVGIARPYPLSIEVLNEWARTLPEKGFQLVPVTAVANRQPIR